MGRIMEIRMEGIKQHLFQRLLHHHQSHAHGVHGVNGVGVAAVENNNPEAGFAAVLMVPMVHLVDVEVVAPGRQGQAPRVQMHRHQSGLLNQIIKRKEECKQLSKKTNLIDFC